jgi:ABC-type glycerol-3-phosphate transport system substrate-binding protein
VSGRISALLVVGLLAVAGCVSQTPAGGTASTNQAPTITLADIQSKAKVLQAAVDQFNAEVQVDPTISPSTKATVNADTVAFDMQIGAIINAGPATTKGVLTFALDSLTKLTPQLAPAGPKGDTARLAADAFLVIARIYVSSMP